MRIRIVDGDKPLGLLFLVHGHQGAVDSDRFSGVSRLVVRYGWRPFQRRFKIPSTTPSRDFALRARHDDAMFQWARKRPEKLVLIAGHTHRPVFSDPKVKTEQTPKEVDTELKRLREVTDTTPDSLADPGGVRGAVSAPSSSATHRRRCRSPATSTRAAAPSATAT